MERPRIHKDAEARTIDRRRLKRVLRLLPRRAVFHRYPLIGRFAPQARRRAYLWSLKPRHVRAAIYVGTLISLWPLMGIQIPLAFAVALLVRANVMVAVALQVLTNPFTAAPVYYFTYRIGKSVLAAFGVGAGGPAGAVAEDMAVAASVQPSLATGTSDIVFTLFLGGTVGGLALAAILDLLYLRIRGRPTQPSPRRGYA
jgi:uncharacterized protein (DUF2062 family)